jgi:hypothetical protein
VCAKLTLVRAPEELLLVPEVRSFDEVAAWAQLADGRTAVKPKQQSVALPQEQCGREPSYCHPLLAAALFEPIRLG